MRNDVRRGGFTIYLLYLHWVLAWVNHFISSKLSEGGDRPTRMLEYAGLDLFLVKETSFSGNSHTFFFPFFSFFFLFFFWTERTKQRRKKKGKRGEEKKKRLPCSF